MRESNEGVGRIFKEMNDYFIEDPVYEEPNGSAVQLTLKNNIVARKDRETGRVSEIITPELFEELNEQEEAIVRYLYNSGRLTTKETAELIERSENTARKWINKLLKKNIVVAHGSGKNDPKRFYTLKDN